MKIPLNISRQGNILTLATVFRQINIQTLATVFVDTIGHLSQTSVAKDHEEISLLAYVAFKQKQNQQTTYQHIQWAGARDSVANSVEQDPDSSTIAYFT